MTCFLYNLSLLNDFSIHVLVKENNELELCRSFLSLFCDVQMSSKTKCRSLENCLLLAYEIDRASVFLLEMVIAIL